VSTPCHEGVSARLYRPRANHRPSCRQMGAPLCPAAANLGKARAKRDCWECGQRLATPFEEVVRLRHHLASRRRRCTAAVAASGRAAASRRRRSASAIRRCSKTST
jgi:hypothetical protein